MASKRMASKGDENFKAGCPKCSCDTVIPLMGIWVAKSFSGNRLRMEWPSRDTRNDQEVANVGCPQCGAVLNIHADGRIVDTGNTLFSGRKVVKGKRGALAKV